MQVDPPKIHKSTSFLPLLLIVLFELPDFARYSMLSCAFSCASCTETWEDRQEVTIWAPDNILSATSEAEREKFPSPTSNTRPSVPRFILFL